MLMKMALYMVTRERGMTREDLMRLLGWNRQRVDRLFWLTHRSRLHQLQRVFEAIDAPMPFTWTSFAA
jgi:antitoxin HicB